MTAQFTHHQINGVAAGAYAARLVPEKVARDFELVPLTLRDNRLLAAGAYPLTRSALAALQRMLRYPLDVVQASLPDVRAARRALYQSPREAPQSFSLMQALRLLGLLNAEQAQQAEQAGDPDPAALALRRGWISAEQFAEAAGWQANLPHLRARSASQLEGMNIFLPFERSEALGVLPLWWVGSTLYLAISADRPLPDEADLLELDTPCRLMVCDPAVYAQLRKQIYRPRPIIAEPFNERRAAKWLAAERSLTSDELALAQEMSARSGIPLEMILKEEFAVSAEDWLEAAAEVNGVIPVHARDLPADINERISALWHVLPEQLLRQFELVPLNQEEHTLILGMPVVNEEVLDMARAFSGGRVEVRLMDKALIRRLQQAARETLRARGVEAEPQVTAVTFGEFLLNTALIQREQLDEQRESGISDEDLPAALLNANLLNELDLAEIFSLVSGIPYVSLEYFQFDEGLMKLLPADLALERRLLPLFEHQGDLWVAVSDLRSAEALGEAAERCGKRVWPLLVPETALLAALNRFYRFSHSTPQAAAIFAYTDALVAKGLLSQADALQAASAVSEQGRALDRVLLDLRVPADALYPTLAAVRGVERVDLGLSETSEQSFDALGQLRTTRRWQEKLDADASRLLDLNTARRLTAIPIAQEADGLKVAFADPLFDEAQQELEFLLEKKIIPCLASRADIEDAIQRLLGQMNLGTSLLLAGCITLSQLNNALALARSSNIRLGRALVHRGYISESELYAFLAHQAGLPLFDLSSATLSEKAARLLDPEEERREGLLPLAVDDSHIYLAMVDPLNEQGKGSVERALGKKVTPILVSENDFDLAMERLYRDEYLDKSTSELLKRAPEDSAFRVFSSGQIIAFITFLAVSIVWLAWDYISYLVVTNSLVSIFYLLFSGYKAVMISNAISSDLEVDVTGEDVAALKDRDLPIYTILVPVYKEAQVLPKLLKRLGEMDYPTAKLDIKILMEAGDQATIDAYYLADPPDFIHAVVVPDAQPKTKPKACNYGLIHARGEYLVIYDAEDLPELDQLKRVVAAFRKVPADVVCIQAKLNYYNRTQNVLTQWFTSEYSMWFDLLLPGLDDAHAPIPLGGTSNHFKTFSLIEVGAWDPYNVTEDADLGIRLYKRGYRTRIVDSTTYEEANSRVGNWIRQRSRWIKGYIQTWLVHMRHPLQLMRDIGPRAFFSFQLLIGGTFFSLLVNPIYWLMTSAWYFFRWDLIQLLFPGLIFFIGAICLYIGNFVFTYVNIAGAMRRKYYDMVRVTLFSPAYWALMSIGAWKGFLQLLTKPHFWEKTIHGLNIEENKEQAQ
jgi:cellulose synthase/poly-beta-1,6-N-acetylglucosamine synthase-like glycosyltransferase/type II secretory ATPase GspE/PulE/Tfp pilus assembly ATPase PilB-like protein